MKNNIFFDLDGTLINSKERLYALYQELAPSSSLSFEGYWSLKRKGKSHKDILVNFLGYTDLQVQYFHTEWMRHIESERLLALDRPIEGVADLLSELSIDFNLYVVTNRQHTSLVHNQINKLGLSGLFRDVFVTGQKISKKDLIVAHVAFSENDFIIGDTGVEVETGKALSIKTVVVTNGFLHKDVLLAYQPDIVLESLLGLKDSLNSISGSN